MDTLNPEWPTPRVASLHKKFLKKQEQFYYQPISIKDVPVLSINNSTAILKNKNWNQSSATHLLSRTMFGASYNDILEATNNTLHHTVNSLLEDTPIPAPPGDWVEDPIPLWEECSDDECSSIVNQYGERMSEIKTWWIIRMSQNSINIIEQMTLFWHNYFATGSSKVFYPQAVYEQNKILRQYGLGNFKELLRRVTFGPAMMIWLDINQSKKGTPNENFSRELMELFTLGLDNYSQNDILEASRAFTGYKTNGLETNYDYENKVGNDVWWDEWHDFGEKTFFGQTGQWTGDDIINIILEQEECAVHICREIYKWFVYESVNEQIIEEMAVILRNNDYEIKPILNFLFKSEHFYENNLRGAKIKNPIDFYISLLRKFGMENNSFQREFLFRTVNMLGMNPYNPPAVNGWVGYRSWINSILLPMRKTIGCALVVLNPGVTPFGYTEYIVNVRSLAQTIYSSEDENYAPVQIVRKLALVLFGLPRPKVFFNNTYRLSNILEAKLLDILLDGAEPYDWNINAPEDDAQWGRMKDLLLYMIRQPEIHLS